MGPLARGLGLRWRAGLREPPDPEVIIALPDMAFDESGIEESIRTVEAKARNEEERAEGRDLLRRAFERQANSPKPRSF